MADKQLRYQNLINAYPRWLYRYAYWLSCEKTAAEDLLQETFLRAWRFFDLLQSEAAAKSWLTTIARNTIATRLHRARRKRHKHLDGSELRKDIGGDQE